MNKLKEYIAYVGYAGCALIIIGVFLPLVKFSISLFGYTSSSSVNYFNGDGKILLGLIVASAVMIFLKKKKLFISGVAASLAVFIYDMIDISKTLGGSSYSSSSYSMSLGAGFYLILLGFILCIGYFFFNKKEVSNESTVDYNQTFSNQNGNQSFNQQGQSDSMMFDSYTIPVEPVTTQTETVTPVINQYQAPVESTMAQEEVVTPVIISSNETVTQNQEIFCQQCGAKLPVGTTTCYVCGKQII